MDGDDRPRDAGNAGSSNGPWVLDDKFVRPAWYDDPSLTPVQMTVTNSDGTTSAVDMTVAEWVRMAESQAGLVAALEAVLLYEKMIYSADGAEVVAQVYAALAKAKGGAA